MTKEVGEEEIAFLKRKVYSAARDGYSAVIFDLLSDMDYRKTTVQAVLNHHSEEEFQYITPLIIASKNGHEEVVDVLLKTFHVDTEETGNVNINGQICNDVTALWCAAATGNFGVVKLLVDNRANITHTAFKHSTPVTVSCFMGRLEILNFLLNHISDKTVAQNNVNDCLLMASSRGHCDIVQYVIQEGADLQFEEIGGNTALHKAAYYGQSSIVQLLVKNGAYMKKNEFNATPLHLAAALGNTEIVEYFISLPECKRLEKIEAFELLGAAFTEYDSYDIAKCYHYFEEAMKERYKDSDKVIEKVLPPPVSAYDNKIECRTLTELERIKSDHKALQMESLAVRERITGLDPLVTATFLINAGVMFYKERDFERCIALWLQALNLSQKSKRAVSLYRFAQIYTEMLQNGQLVFETLLEVFVYATNEVQLEMKLISKSGIIPWDALPQEHYE